MVPAAQNPWGQNHKAIERETYTQKERERDVKEKDEEFHWQEAK